MAFEDIVLKPEELKLLKEMTDGEPRDSGTPSVLDLRGYELVNMVQKFPSPGHPAPYRMLYKINEYGKRYLLYLERKDSASEHEKHNGRLNFWLNIIEIVIALIAAIASVKAVLK